MLNEGLQMLGAYEVIGEKKFVGKVFLNSALESIRLPSTLKDIECNTFENCKNLKSVWLPDKLERIGKQCFRGSGLEELMIPKSIKSIGDGAFQDSALKKIIVEKGCQADVKSAVRSNVTVQTVYEVKIPAGTTIITENQFRGQNVYRVFIPESVSEIWDYAFYACENLREVVIEEGSKLKTIGMIAFSDCRNLTKMTFPKELEKIGIGAFSEVDSKVWSFRPRSE